MLFFIFIAIFIIGIIICIKEEDSFSSLHFAGEIICVIGVLTVSVSLIVILINNINITAQMRSDMETYKVLEYEVSNNLYESDNDIGKQELMQRVSKWNSKIAYYKYAQDNFWVGIYIPNIYDMYDYVDYTKVINKEKKPVDNKFDITLYEMKR